MRIAFFVFEAEFIRRYLVYQAQILCDSLFCYNLSMFWITITWSVTGKHNAFEAKIVNKNSLICITTTTFKIIETPVPKNTHLSPSSRIFRKRTRLDENNFCRSHTQWRTACFYLAHARNEVVRISPFLAKSVFWPYAQNVLELDGSKRKQGQQAV